MNEVHFDDAPESGSSPRKLSLVQPPDWCGTTAEPMSWLAHNRIPLGDVTILSSDGGGGKTTIALQLAVAVAGDLGNWLGVVVENNGPVIFISAEEDEPEVRRRLERICRGCNVELDMLTRLHLHFPDLEATAFTEAARGDVKWTAFFRSFEAAIRQHSPALVIIDSVAAVFTGDHRDRAQVRMFMSRIRKLAHATGAAILFLDHPSLNGMSDGSGRAGSVDWSNVVRARLYLSDAKGDRDARELEVMKSNRGPKGEKVLLRWRDGAFTVEGSATPIERQAEEAKVDDLFLKILDKRNAQGRQVSPRHGRSFAPAEFSKDADAGKVTSKAFAASMERLYNSRKIVSIKEGPPSRQTTHIERAKT